MKVYTDQPRETMMFALEELFKLVAPTYGPNGRGILIDRDYKQEILDDGHKIIEEFELKDELHNAVIKYIREASRKTNSRAGDGTTTAFLIMIAILREVFGESSKYLIDSELRGLTKNIRIGLEEAVEKIKVQAKTVETEEDLFSVAKNSFANEKIAKIIASAVFAIGKDGTVIVETSDLLETTSKVVQGMSVDKGYISPFMTVTLINGIPTAPENGIIELKNPLIVIADSVINTVKQVSPIIELSAKDGERRSVLFICEDFTAEALNLLVSGRMRGVFNMVAIKSPGFGNKKSESLKDLALITGATVLSDQAGFTLAGIKENHFGGAKKVIVSSDETIFVDGKGEKEKIDAHVEALKALETKSAYEKRELELRISKLTGGIATIQVGALTQTDASAIKEKVDDAKNATMLAFRGGVVAGGGKTLMEIETTSEILNKSLKFPRGVLESNGVEELSEDAIDPVGVLVAALESAVSVATSLIDCGGILAPKIEKKKDEEV